MGFFLGLIAFVVTNLIVHVLAETALMHRTKTIADGGGYYSGFPFTMYFFGGGNPFVSKIIWSGVIADMVVALVASHLIGLLVLKISQLRDWKK